jgi:hypothetical protein
VNVKGRLLGGERREEAEVYSTCAFVYATYTHSLCHPALYHSRGAGVGKGRWASEVERRCKDSAPAEDVASLAGVLQRSAANGEARIVPSPHFLPMGNGTISTLTNCGEHGDTTPPSLRLIEASRGSSTPQQGFLIARSFAYSRQSEWHTPPQMIAAPRQSRPSRLALSLITSPDVHPIQHLRVYGTRAHSTSAVSVECHCHGSSLYSCESRLFVPLVLASLSRLSIHSQSLHPIP